MKKIFILSVLLLMMNNVFSQNITKEFINKIIETTNAVISENKSEIIHDVVNLTIICDLPSYINGDMIILTCNTIVVEYPNIKVFKPWEKSNKKDLVIVYEVNNKLIQIYYGEIDKDNKMLIISY